jgi:hypothetical protein
MITSNKTKMHTSHKLLNRKVKNTSTCKSNQTWKWTLCENVSWTFTTVCFLLIMSIASCLQISLSRTTSQMQSPFCILKLSVTRHTTMFCYKFLTCKFQLRQLNEHLYKTTIIILNCNNKRILNYKCTLKPRPINILQSCIFCCSSCMKVKCASSS